MLYVNESKLERFKLYSLKKNVIDKINELKKIIDHCFDDKVYDNILSLVSNLDETYPDDIKMLSGLYEKIKDISISSSPDILDDIYNFLLIKIIEFRQQYKKNLMIFLIKLSEKNNRKLGYNFGYLLKDCLNQNPITSSQIDKFMDILTNEQIQELQVHI